MHALPFSVSMGLPERSHDATPLGGSVLPASRGDWLATCNRSLRGHVPHLLMVPKTGSRSLLALANCPGYVRYRTTRKANGRKPPNKVWFHNMAYRDCSIATLRDPCERAVSIFRHLKERYPVSQAEPKYCKFNATPACPQHWLHNATTVDDFVSLLATHWAEIAAHPITDTYSSKRHLVVALPQYRWIGPLRS